MTIRETVVAQADRLGLTAYAIAHGCKVGGEFVVSVNHVQEYLAGRKDMTSAKLDAVFLVLGLEVSQKVKVKRGPQRNGKRPGGQEHGTGPADPGRLA